MVGPNQLRGGLPCSHCGHERAGIHQTGGVIRAKTAKGLAFTLANGESAVVGSVTIPARPYLGISEAEREEIEEVSLQHFADILDEELR